MKVEEIKRKMAENVKERAELELQQQEYEKHERLKRALYIKQAEDKRIAEANYLRDKARRDQEQIGKNQAKSSRNTQMKARNEANENLRRDRARGLTEEEIRMKYLDVNARVDELNKRNTKQTEASLKGAKTFLSDMY